MVDIKLMEKESYDLISKCFEDLISKLELQFSAT